MRPGWGRRHPDVAELLRTQRSRAEHDLAWVHGRVSAYVGLAALPDDLVLSVRCIVRVGDSVVICTNADGFTHPWPGGRREPGEQLAETACREVHEETGWFVDAASLQQLGWLHFEKFGERPPDSPHPHPDFFQVVFAGRASTRDVAQGKSWSDVEGYELSSRLLPLVEAVTFDELEPPSRVYLDLLEH